MNTTLDITITPGQLKYLGTLLSVKLSPVSPFFGKDVKPELADENRRELITKKILTTDNKVAANWLPVLDGLAETRKFASVSFGNRTMSLEVMAYHSKSGSVLLVADGQNIRILTPAPLDVVVGLMDQQLGNSIVRSVDMDVSLKNAEALLMMALIDLRRRYLLGLMLNREFSPMGIIPASAASDWVATAAPPQWLTGHLKSFLDTSADLAPDVITQAVEELVKRKLVAEEKGGIAPGSLINMLAERLLVLDGLITARSVQLDDSNRSVYSVFQIAISSVTDLLLWDVKGRDSLRLLSIAPGAAVRLLAGFLVDPTVIKNASIFAQSICPECKAALPEKAKFCLECGAKLEKPEPKPPAPPAKNISSVNSALAKQPQPAVISKCTKCGTALEPGSKFCLSCGTKAGASDKPSMQAAPVFCANCGAKAAPGEKFCASCGKAL